MTDRSPKTISELMDAFGGPSAFARAIGLNCSSTANEMKRNGGIAVGHWPKIIAAAAERGVKGVSPDALMWMQGKKPEPRPVTDRESEGWKEAAIAWTVCASLHRHYCKGRDPFFKTRQKDFVRHENNARAKLAQLIPQGEGR